MVKITVTAVGGRRLPLAPGLPVTLEIAGKTTEVATVGDVKAAFAVKYPQFYASRQKLTLKGDKKALKDEATLASAGLTDGTELEIKDLGPQISWKTVFLIEYVGPLIIHPLMYYLPRVFYGGPVQHSLLQRYVFLMVILHFLKREYETLFVHRFSHGTMPFNFVFRNSAHYHILGGLLLAYSVYSPTYSATSPYIQGTVRDDPRFLWAYTAVWLFAELSNLKTHAILRDLRPAGTTKRAIPYGYGFDFVSCPNYTFEILGWTVISLMTGSYSAWFFNIAGALTMINWAFKKHRNYKKEFGKEYPKRKAIFPFIL
ncbi:hypothetical protein NM688_g2629 [Phlebia brevispora]|uniref:Uncharacterized protein n=1 Tax=Phlebia brevispora TaxID=194682 RepID=A0ACC1T872_9APHY|nr:hypothetical protein NM688_g2629 [Phlebia brevispora]